MNKNRNDDGSSVERSIDPSNDDDKPGVLLFLTLVVLWLLCLLAGDIVIGPEAKIVQSFNVEGSFVHEVSDLISPSLLWRYCDQLRIL